MGLENAYFGMQCFWGESVFAKVRLFLASTMRIPVFSSKGFTTRELAMLVGRRRIRPTKALPTILVSGWRRQFINMNSLEVTEVKFDPSVLSYRELVDFFWSHHDPVGPRKKQYQSAILYANDEQKKARRVRGRRRRKRKELQIAEETKQREEKKHEDIETYIEPIDVFYQAEDYHQKYWLRCKRDIFESLHLTDEQVADSLLATKVSLSQLFGNRETTRHKT